MIAAVREIVPEADPKQILVDFESVPVTEYKNSYPNTEIKEVGRILGAIYLIVEVGC